MIPERGVLFHLPLLQSVYLEQKEQAVIEPDQDVEILVPQRLLPVQESETSDWLLVHVLLLRQVLRCEWVSDKDRLDDGGRLTLVGSVGGGENNLKKKKHIYK